VALQLGVQRDQTFIDNEQECFEEAIGAGRRSSLDNDKNKQKSEEDFLQISLSHGHAPTSHLSLRYLCKSPEG
jgi:hypothetical protein